MTQIMQIVGAMLMVGVAVIVLCLATALAYFTVTIIAIMVKDQIAKKKRAKRRKEAKK